MEHVGIDLSNIAWYEGPRDPEPCAVCGPCQGEAIEGMWG